VKQQQRACCRCQGCQPPLLILLLIAGSGLRLLGWELDSRVQLLLLQLLESLLLLLGCPAVTALHLSSCAYAQQQQDQQQQQVQGSLQEAATAACCRAGSTPELAAACVASQLSC
jgi:hypothetical protein